MENTIIKRRSDKELLNIFLNNTDKFQYGLCHWNQKLYVSSIINVSEFLYIEKMIDKNTHKVIRFLNILFFWNKNNISYYWKMGNIKPRIKWLKRHLK